MKDIQVIKELLMRANEFIIDNIEMAENIDLEHMSQMIEHYIDDLNEIGDFEVYDEN